MNEWMNERTNDFKVTIQMKATEQYFPVVLLIMLYKVVLTFESANEPFKRKLLPLSRTPLLRQTRKVTLTFESRVKK